MPRGRFIVLEGIDGSGTTSQCAALASRLRERGHSVLETREPSAGSIGRLIRDNLAQDRTAVDPRTLALLFAADRLDHLAREIDPAIERGEVVISDRYLMSSWVYQAIDCDEAWVREVNRWARWPDLTLFLDVPAKVAFARVHERGDPAERFETARVQDEVARRYLALVRSDALADIVRIDGTAAQDVVTDSVFAACARLNL